MEWTCVHNHNFLLKNFFFLMQKSNQTRDSETNFSNEENFFLQIFNDSFPIFLFSMLHYLSVAILSIFVVDFVFSTNFFFFAHYQFFFFFFFVFSLIIVWSHTLITLLSFFFWVQFFFSLKSLFFFGSILIIVPG